LSCSDAPAGAGARDSAAASLADAGATRGAARRRSTSESHAARAKGDAIAPPRVFPARRARSSSSCPDEVIGKTKTPRKTSFANRSGRWHSVPRSLVSGWYREKTGLAKQRLSHKSPSRRRHRPSLTAHRTHPHAVVYVNDAFQRECPVEPRVCGRAVRVASPRAPPNPPGAPLTEIAHPTALLSSSPQRNIELGRVCLVNLAADPLYGKLVTIVDFVDMNRVRIFYSSSARMPRVASKSARVDGKP
jgi:hypothetical protein